MKNNLHLAVCRTVVGNPKGNFTPATVAAMEEMVYIS
jgi:hypothetical protein